MTDDRKPQQFGRRAALKSLGAGAVAATAVTARPAPAHASAARPFAGQCAVVTGAARGIGRDVAVRLARLGADVVAVDVPGSIPTVPYPLGTMNELATTARQVRAAGARCHMVRADIRDAEAMTSVFKQAATQFGHVDIVVANAAVLNFGDLSTMDPQEWKDVIDVNVNGTAFTLRAAIPHMKKQGKGTIVVVGSAEAREGGSGSSHYITSKWALIGLTKCAAYEVAGSEIRVVGVNPTVTRTPMILNEAAYAWAGVSSEAELDGFFRSINLLDVGILEPGDVGGFIVELAKPEFRYVTGTFFDLNAGLSAGNMA
ncbi:SDR family NAD(P)-dependent oxidoreductase [Actinomycetota bacterium]